MCTQVTKYGTSYESPVGLNQDIYYEMMYEFINLVKIKGLTTRQAQKLFIDCSDMVLDIKSNEEHPDIDYLKSIAKSLNKISNRGIDIFERCATTNRD